MTTYRDYLTEEPVRGRRIRVAKHRLGKAGNELEERLAEFAVRVKQKEKRTGPQVDRSAEYLRWVHRETTDWRG